MLISSSFCKYSRPTGKDPTNLFSLMSNTVALWSSVISSGKQPERPLWAKLISSKVSPILPMLFGRQPLKWFCATTITEAGELPKFSGRLEWNLLLFMNMASSCLSKRAGGNAPSKSLNLISRYLRFGNSRTTCGNGPTKRLLLTSSSYRRVSLEMLFGIIPQNLLELRWRRLMSVSKPISTGRWPAMSAWLRSIPATTVTFGSSSAGAQKTPVY